MTILLPKYLKIFPLGCNSKQENKFPYLDHKSGGKFSFLVINLINLTGLCVSKVGSNAFATATGLVDKVISVG